MISEKQLSEYFHSSLWQHHFPLLDPRFVKRFNVERKERVYTVGRGMALPVPINPDVERFDLVVELAFELSVESYKKRIGDVADPTKAIQGALKRILVYDDAESVEEWRRVAPELPLIVSPPQSVKAPQQLANFASKLGVEVLDGAWKGYSLEMVTAAQKAGVQVWPDIQSAQEDSTYFEKVMALGFTGVQTDHPEELIRWLTQQGRR